MKIRSVGAELFRADRWADMTKPIVAFRNFAKGLIKECALNETLCSKAFCYSVMRFSK